MIFEEVKSTPSITGVYLGSARQAAASGDLTYKNRGIPLDQGKSLCPTRCTLHITSDELGWGDRENPEARRGLKYTLSYTYESFEPAIPLQAAEKPTRNPVVYNDLTYEEASKRLGIFQRTPF